MNAFLTVGVLFTLFCLSMALYSYGYEYGQRSAYSNKWWYQPVRTADGEYEFHQLTKPVTRPTTAE